MEFTAEIIAGFLDGTIEGDPQVKVNTITKIEEGEPGALAFLSNPKYEEYIYHSKASIVIVNRDFVAKGPIEATLLRVDNAYKAFASLLELYVANKPRKEGISPKSSIAPTATLGQGVYVGEFAVLDEGCSVGQGSQIFPQVYVGDRVRIGSNCKICAGVKIYEDCVLGDNITIHSGTVIGGDGFGFAPTEDGSFQKIPQIGNVVIEDDVEIGANTCIDRATMGSTIIRRGVKLDNLIQIAHNVVVGSNTVMAAQVGVAGSAKIGQNVMMGGQVGVVGHITIADGVKIGSQSGIGASVDKPGVVMFGSPAMPGLQNHRVHAILKELPELRAKLLKVVREMETLKNNGNS
ncbi:MAG: UDP-3-O-(3-hydroxymyristoyl)glucosamine N-acyltransferase [Mucinivorans sp.]